MKWIKPLGGDIYERRRDAQMVFIVFVLVCLAIIIGSAALVLGLVKLILWSLS